MQTPPRMPAHGSDSPLIQHGALVIDLEGYSVRVSTQDVPLTLSEFLLLKELAQHPYQVYDRQALADALLQQERGYDRRRSSPRAVDILISRLRRKLGRAGYDCIKTMKYVGYRFVPEGAAAEA